MLTVMVVTPVVNFMVKTKQVEQRILKKIPGVTDSDIDHFKAKEVEDQKSQRVHIPTGRNETT